MKAAHLHRHTGAGGRARKAKPRAAPAVAYPAGFFTELLRKHNFPPGWRPALLQGPARPDTAPGATANREAGRAFGGHVLELLGAKQYIAAWKQLAAAAAAAGPSNRKGR